MDANTEQIVENVIRCQRALYKAQYFAAKGRLYPPSSPLLDTVVDALESLIMVKRPIEVLLHVDFTEEAARQSREEVPK